MTTFRLVDINAAGPGIDMLYPGHDGTDDFAFQPPEVPPQRRQDWVPPTRGWRTILAVVCRWLVIIGLTITILLLRLSVALVTGEAGGIGPGASESTTNVIIGAQEINPVSGAGQNIVFDPSLLHQNSRRVAQQPTVATFVSAGGNGRISF